MSRVPPVLLGLLGIAGLTWLCATHHRPHIEADLSNRSQTVLNELGLNNLKATAEGQIVTIEGEAPDEQARQHAIHEVGLLFGVEQVRARVTIQPLRVATPAQAEAPAKPLSTEFRAAENCQIQFNGLLASETIRFAPNSATIEPASFSLLDRIAEAAAQCPAARIEIGGHTDSVGSMEVNQIISRARAISVMSGLIGRGIGASRLSAAGYGSSRPIADNATPEGMQRNRRTELKVLGL